MDLREMLCLDLNWIQLDLCMVDWWGCMTAVMILREY